MPLPEPSPGLSPLAEVYRILLAASKRAREGRSVRAYETEKETGAAAGR